METPEPSDGILPERPDRLKFDDPLAPRLPWSFGKEAGRGGFGFWGLQLIVGWLVFQLLSSATWALHLRRHTGFDRIPGGASGLPTHWGEMLSARDLWELLENGGLKHDLLGTATPVIATLGLLWLLWAGWRLQAEAAGVPGKLGPWLLALLDTALIGLLPLTLAAWPVLWLLGKVAGFGFATLGWINLVGGSILRLSVVSAILLQWWFCRLNRAASPSPSIHLGSWGAYWRHLRESFLRLWLHPVHWATLLVGATTLRLGLAWFALWLGWRLGGGTSGRVWLFLMAQAVATAAGAWLIGWSLRVSALFWAQDRRVQLAKSELEARYGEPDAEPAET